VGLRPLDYWDCGFESRLGHGCLSVVSVVCCQVDVYATGWSLVQRSPTECGVSECDREALIMRRPRPPRGCCTTGERERGTEYRIKKKIFFCEGPRSRCYGRTAALRLIVQPCDENDQLFSFFQVMEHRWNEIDRGKPKY
jgi:hypothetical protein